MNIETKPKDFVVLYDGECPYCDREIRHYMRLDTAQRIRWQNIDESPDYLRKHDISWNSAMGKLHSIENGEVVHIGVDSFIEIWRRIDRYRYLSRIVAFKSVYVVMGKIYDTFAAWRLNRRCTSKNTCKSGAQSLT